MVEMEWHIGILVLLLFRVGALQVINTGSLQESFGPVSFDNADDEASSESGIFYEDNKLEHLGKLLANTILQPWPKGVSPILYVEEYPTEPIQPDQSIDNNNFIIGEQQNEPLNNVPFKRSRYYRKYPWKRQNSRYDAENKYLCQPSKEDVFRLLVALHEARRGSREQMVNFCNRKRPASAVFTNIRFLG